MRFLLLFIFLVSLSLTGYGQMPTINAFPVGSSSVAPYSGATGTTMTITGTNFTGATAVSFGGTPASSFTVVNATTITAVVGSGSSDTVSVTTSGGTAKRAGFTYLPLSRIITDFGGFWSSTTASANTTNPDNAHNVLGFAFNNTFYSTGVNDAILTSNGISFTTGNYRSLPVAGIAGTTSSGSSVYLAMASKVDGNATSGVVSGVASSTVQSVLTDGVRGLNLGTGVTNLPASALLTFNINSIDATKISDAEPDILITQIADPTPGNDIFKFVDASGAIVGNTVTQDMTVLTSFGLYNLDLFAFSAGISYNAATPSTVAFTNVTRSIRLVAFKLSDFGITAGNYTSIRTLKVTPSSNSDYAFIAYNANAINIPPNISQSDTSAGTLCITGGTAVLGVVGAAASGGTLSYSWEQSTDNGSTWSAVTNGGNFSGATTQTLSVANSPASGTQYRATVAETGSATPATSSPFTISYAPLSAGGSISGGTTVCTGTNSTVLTLSGKTGNVIRWESSINSFGSTTPIANTTSSLTVTNLTATTQYRAVVQSSPCATSNSSVSTITVSPLSAGGSISGSATVCTGTNSTVLTLSGNTGTVTKWQSSTDNFTSIITDVVNTTTSLTATNLTATTKYRAVVQSGSCAPANSTAATVTVSPATNAGSISGSATVCTGTNSTLLTLHGYVGAILKWQFSIDTFATSTDVTNTTANLTATNLTASTQYRAVVQSGACGTTVSVVATVTVKLLTTGGSVSGSASVCTGTNSTNLTLSGYRGSIIRWQSSTDNFSTYANIVNTTATLTATNLTTTTQYRANVKNGPCDSAISAIATVTVVPVSVGGAVTGDATVCSGTNSTTLTLSGYTGSVSKWQSSTDNFASVINDIINTTTSLTAANLTATTQLRAVVQSGVCASANSSTATITVHPTSVGGSIAGSASVCTGINSTTLTLSGYTGAIIKWQSSTDNFASVTNDIANSTTDLTAANLTATTQYRVVVQSGTCASAISQVAIVTVNAVSVGGVLTGGGRICAPPNSKTLTLSGNTGNVVKWQSSADYFITDSTDITNTTNTLTLTDVAIPTQYRAIVQSGNCAAVYSTTDTIIIVSAGEWVGGSSGNYTLASNWCGGIPAATANVVVPANTLIYINSADVTVNSLTINSTATVVMLGAYNLNIAAGGNLTNNGSFNGSSSTGTVSFLGNGTISGTTNFQNLDTKGALDFGTTSTVSGNFTLQAGGSVTGNAPVYSCPSSTLIYNTGGIFTRNMEWLAAASGKGFPSNVIIQNSTTLNFSVAGNGYICNDLTITAGSALLQDYSAGSAPLAVGRNVTIKGILSLGAAAGGDISVSGNWTRDTGGVFINNRRNVNFKGTGNSVITAPELTGRDVNGAFGGETFFNLDINKTSASDSVSLGSNITILNEVKYSTGIFDLVNSDVTVTSNDTTTAHIAPLHTVSGVVTGVAIRYGGIAGTGTGKFVIQRHLSIGTESSARRWRLLAAPLDTTGAPTINMAWQEGVSNSDRNLPVDPWPGFGTTITKSSVYDSLNGYDQGSTNNASLMYYTDAGWTVLPSTHTPITGYEGYMLFARGNRGIVVSTPSINANSTKLEPKGRINIGDLTKTMIIGFQTIGNPYASAINFSKILFSNYSSNGSTFDTTAGSPEGVGITYYLWDPKTNGSNGVGKFITCSSNGDGTYAVTTNDGGIPADGTIPSGTAFMMTADIGGARIAENSGGSLTFHETDKLSTNLNIIARPAMSLSVRSTFTSSLYAGTGPGAKLIDGVINVYGDYKNAVDGRDAKSISGFGNGEALSVLRSGSFLSVERRSRIIANDTIFLVARNLKTAAYRFHFKPLDFNPSILVVLEDKFTGLATRVSVMDTSNFSFNVTNDPNSFAPDRFRLVFKPALSLPLTFSNITAYRQNDNILVNWTVQNQAGIAGYDVEKSIDGAHFTAVNKVDLAGDQQTAASYKWLDTDAIAGDDFYRIQYHMYNGTVAYSTVAKVVFLNSKTFIRVYPTPVTDGNIILELNNISAGEYHVQITDNLGKVISRTLITHTGGNARQMLTLKNLISGNYQLQLTATGKKTRSIKIVVK